MKLHKPLIVILTSVAVTSALAQKTVSLYQPGADVKDQGMSLRGWGSGTISQTDETFYEGSYSLRISTRSFFQGGIVSLATPVDLTSEFTNKNDLLRFAFKVADGGVMGGGPGRGVRGAPGGPNGIPGGPGGPGGGPGRARGGPGGGFPGGPGGGQFPGAGAGRGQFPGAGQIPGGGPGGRGQFPGAGQIPGGGQFPGAPGGRGAQSASAAPTFKSMRVIVTTSDGKKSEVYIPVNTSVSSAEQGWRQVAVPLQAITGFDRTNKSVKSIAISGDATATFYVGAINIVNDSTPITGDVNTHDLNLAQGDEFEFIASGSGGSTPLKYSWDFDASDGIQVDAVGQTVTRKFRKPGDYTITLTIADLYGLKTPYTTTIHAVVNP